jgi:hypothetical protein
MNDQTFTVNFFKSRALSELKWAPAPTDYDNESGRRSTTTSICIRE